VNTPEPTLEALANRVAKLEAQNRRLKRAGIASLVIVSSIIAMGQASTRKVIEANEFVLRDASGIARARLSMEATDRPTLSFYKDKTAITASLAGGDEPFLTMQRTGTSEQVMLGANKDFLGLGLYEKEIRAGFSVQKGVPGLELYNEHGKPQASLNLASLVPSLTMMDPEDKAFLSLGVSSMSGGPNFGMYDSAGKLCASLVTADGEPSLKLADKEGFSATFGSSDLIVPSTGRKEHTSAASLVLFGKDNKVLWSAP
jgi:hypothetical protein